ncbi:MAG: 5'/3'-nucleotidase SurE [Deltaproteobacteria bacterium]|nr:5'/3'-nucleotidase SurE [Deltaproteobacteria bacterium]
MAPLILITNDDGIRSPGIAALIQALAPLGEIRVVAPSRQQSAVSHKITLGEPLRMRTEKDGRVAVSGTPVDAVFMAMHQLLPRKPDLVISGINLGLNLGTDVFYSGTFAAAAEAALKGVAAIAVSQQLPIASQSEPHEEGPGHINWADAMQGEDLRLGELLAHTALFTARLAEELLGRNEPLPPLTALNVNAPATLSTSYRVTRVGARVYRGEVITRRDPRGIPYYWIGGPALDRPEPIGTDAKAIQDGLISVSPLRLDWTAIDLLDQQLSISGFDAEVEAQG